MNELKVKKAVREGYAKIAKQESSCCGPAKSSCAGPDRAVEIGKSIGYSAEELKLAPESANLGLGCGNPVALASLKKGEVVLDLGSGAGLDCFLAANQVGPTGRVIGVDMTPEMIEKARENALQGNYTNVDFRLGEIENLPAPDNSVDAIISNCVINLAPDKTRVFKEAFRVLKSGGRLMISDLVLQAELPDLIKNSMEAYVGCLSRAMLKHAYLEAIRSAGFQEVKIVDQTSFSIDYMLSDPTAQAIIGNMKVPTEEVRQIAGSVVSVKVQAFKP